MEKQLIKFIGGSTDEIRINWRIKMGNNMKGIVGLVAGYATLLGIMHRASKILKDRAEERTADEKQIFKNRDLLQKKTEDIRWKEKEKMFVELRKIGEYSDAMERVHDLQMTITSSKNLNVGHGDLNFKLSSGNEDVARRLILREENKLREIETIVQKSIEAGRSEEEKQLFEEYDQVLRAAWDILKRERVGLWKEVIFGWLG